MPTHARQMANDQVCSAASCFAAQAEAQPGGRYSVVTEFMLRLLVGSTPPATPADMAIHPFGHTPVV
jgi:hypothetical protein